MTDVQTQQDALSANEKHVARKAAAEKKKAEKAKKAARTPAATLKKYRDQGNYSYSDGYAGLSLNNGDNTAQMLAMLEPERVVALAEKVLPGIKRGELKKKYAALNRGMKRMNAGNRIRAAIKKGTVTEAQVKRAITGKTAA